MTVTAKREWLALALLSVVQFMVVLDIAIVNVALPSIQVDLGFSQENLQWVISAYALFFGGFLLLGGRSADLLGRRRIFLGGLVVFTLSSLFAGLAWSEASLITARAFQGLGAAIITPAALSILSTTFHEGRERNVALGVWGAVGGFGAAAGVLMGGILTDALSWEWIFFVNVPVGVLAIVLAPILLDESRDASVKTFDLPGAVLVTAGLSSLVYAITQAGQEGWLAGRTIGFTVGSLALLAGFVGWELRHPEPLMRFGLLRTKTGRARMWPDSSWHGDVLDVPDADALHATGARLLRDGDRRRLPRGRRDGDHLVGRRGPARDARRRQAGARRRDDLPHRRPDLLHAGLGGRLLRDRPPAGVPAHRGRDRLLVRADHDRGARRRRARRGGTGLRPDQHVAADRRCARDRGALDHRDLRTGDAVSAGTAVPSALVDGFTDAFVAGAIIAGIGIVAALTLIRRDELAQPQEVMEPALDLAA